MSHRSHPLVAWIEANMPELDAELLKLPGLDECRVRLNEITGLKFQHSDVVNDCMDEYLAKLKEMKK